MNLPSSTSGMAGMSSTVPLSGSVTWVWWTVSPMPRAMGELMLCGQPSQSPPEVVRKVLHSTGL